MNWSLYLATMALGGVTAVPGRARAQQRSEAVESSQGGVGVGASALGTRAFFGERGVPVSIFLPLQIRGTFRVEPEVGYYQSAVNQTTPDGDFRTNYIATRFALGAQYMWAVERTTSAYAGARFGLMYWRSERPDLFGLTGEPPETVETKRTDLFVAVVVGGEYFLSSSFSLGAEVALSYTSLGDEDVSPPSASVVENQTSWVIATDALLFFRVYFWSF